jgi:hypothetical protein
MTAAAEEEGKGGEMMLRRTRRIEEATKVDKQHQ